MERPTITRLRAARVEVGDWLWNVSLGAFVLLLCVAAVCCDACSRSASTPSEPCFTFIGSAGPRPILLDRCTGAVKLGVIPYLPPPPPAPPTTIPREAF